MEFKVIEATDRYTIASLAGRLDAAGVQAIEIKFLANTASRKKPAVIDVSGVNFLASIGIRMILSCAKALMASGAKMALVNPQPLIEETFAITGLGSLIPMTRTQEEALDQLGIKK